MLKYKISDIFWSKKSEIKHLFLLANCEGRRTNESNNMHCCRSIKYI